MNIDMQQFHQVFFQEAEEHLDQLESILLSLDPENAEGDQLNEIFRAAHSIKGGSAIFGLEALTGLTHVMESLLDLARKKTLTLTENMVDQLLESTDTLKEIVDCYHQDTDIDWDKIADHIKKLEAFCEDPN